MRTSLLAASSYDRVPYRGCVAAEVLTQRTLNRTLLLRQGLLERSDTPPLAMVERLVGMQAQVPANPYVALWARLRDFDPQELSELLASRQLARANLLRNTLHLVTAADCLALHPLTTPLRIRSFRSPFGAALNGADPEAVAEAARALVAEAPRTRAELSARLAERWPDAEPLALAYVATHYLPLVQLPPRGLWGGRGLPTYALADEWLGAPLDARADLAPFVRRYLAAFGPATPADVRTWAGVTGLRPAIDALRPELRTFRDEQGRELLDVRDAPIADPDLPAPPRFLPEYDNVTLSHADRSRVVAPGGPPTGTPALLVDGRARAAWKLEDGELVISGYEPAPQERAAIEAEGAALLRFLAVTEPRVRFAP
jgi:hypothetical protein